MNTSLADPPVAPGSETPAAARSPSPPSGGAPDTATSPQPPAPEHVCAHCGTPLQEGQQWCLQCGACEPGSLSGRPNWRPLTALVLTAAILAAGAAVATAAALSKHKAATRPPAVALVPATTPTAPATAPPATPGLPATPGTSATTGTGAATNSAGKGSANNLLFPPSTSAKPPKLPAPAAGVPAKTGGSTGESTGSPGGSTTSTPAKSNTTETGNSTTESNSNSGSGESEKPNPILLDTDAATTYNPYSYPEAGFGDPALAIDGESSTAWTAQIQPSSFPKMAEGLLINLRSSTKLGSVEIRTPTRGMTIQVYGANGHKAPATITDPGWTQLSSSHVLKKTVTHIKLGTEGNGNAFSLFLVWITKAPPASQGSAQAPGHVALSEVSLFPPSS